MNKRHATILAIAAVIILIAASVPGIVRASTVVRSRSNIANNRLVVIGTTLGQANVPDGGAVTLIDNESGEIWTYSAKALAGNAPPKYVGTIDNVGEPARIDSRYARVQ